MSLEFARFPPPFRGKSENCPQKNNIIITNNVRSIEEIKRDEISGTSNNLMASNTSWPMSTSTAFHIYRTENSLIREKTAVLTE